MSNDKRKNMQYIKGMQFYQNDKKTAITLGKFDGLHRGHETLIERVIEHQKNDGVDSVVFAFDMAPLYEKIKRKKKSDYERRTRRTLFAGWIIWWNAHLSRQFRKSRRRLS